MNRVEDERIKFYLKHETQIEEWYAIKKDASAFTTQFYKSLLYSLERPAAELEGDVESFYSPGEGWPRVGLRRQAWRQHESTPEIAMQWLKRGTTLATEGGLWCGVHLKYGTSLSLDSKPAGFPKSEAGLPAYAYVEGPRSEYWRGENLKDYRKALIERLLSAWRELSPLVDKAVGHKV